MHPISIRFINIISTRFYRCIVHVTTTLSVHRRRLGILLIILCSAHVDVAAQSSSFDDTWRWISFTTESGLPSNRVLKIIESADSTLWAVTTSGIAWYDGYIWHPMKMSQGLPEVYFQAVATDERGYLLLSQGDELYYGNKMLFQRIPFSRTGKRQTIIAVAYRSNGKFLLHYTDGTLHEYDRMKRSIEPLPEPNSRGITFLSETKDKSIVISRRDGLRQSQENEFTPLLSSVYPIGVLKFAGNSSGNNIAVISYPPEMLGVWEWSRQHAPEKIQNVNAEQISGLDISEDGNIVISYIHGGFVFRDRGVWKTLASPPFHLRNVLFFQYAANGDLWAGSETGLYYFRNSLRRWSYWKQSGDDSRNQINQIIRTHDGAFWIASVGGIEVRHPDGTVKFFSEINGRSIKFVTGVEEDRNHHIWISTGTTDDFAGAYRWNGTRWDHFGVKQGLPISTIHRVIQDRSGRLWFLGMEKYFTDQTDSSDKSGVYFYDGTRFRQISKKQGLRGTRVYAFAEGSDSSLWFGTNEGLCRLKQNRWTYWTNRNGLLAGRVFTLALDSLNNVWFGDQSYGLGYLTADSIHYFTTKDGLVNDAVWEVKFDAQGKLWIATSGGLGSLHNGIWSKFDFHSGLLSARLWSILPVGDKIYAGTMGSGVAILSTEVNHQSNPIIYASKPQIEEGNVRIHWNAFGYWGEPPPMQIETRYRLDDGEWSAWSTVRDAMLPDMSRGDHRFQIQAKNIFGTYDEAGVMMEFTIPPAVYLRPEYFVPFSLLLLVIVGLVVQMALRRKKNEQALRKSELQYRSLFENANDAIIIFRPDTEEILQVNDRACKMYGFTREELIGMSLKKITVDVPRGEREIQELLQHGSLNNFETTQLRKDGLPIDLVISSSLIDYEGAKAILSINHDVTEAKRAQKQLRQYADELHESNITKDKFFSIISHDLRGPFSTLLGFVELLPEEVERMEKKTLQQITRNIETLAKRTFSLLENLLQWSRLQRRKIEYHPRTIRFADSVASAFFLLREKADRKRITLRSEIPADIFANADETILESILQNLVSNAIKFTHQGGTVSIRVKRAGTHHHISVVDTGIGMSASTLEKLFRIDVQHTTIGTDEERGTGLGLALCKEFVEIHDGKIWAESVEGSGSTFHFTIPAA